MWIICDLLLNNFMENVVYTVIVDGNLLRCVDTSNGSYVGSVNILGNVVSGPIVTGDRCTVVFEDYMGRKGRVFKLPNFNNVSTFDA
jgi:hypothetical protein